MNLSSAGVALLLLSGCVRQQSDTPAPAPPAGAEQSRRTDTISPAVVADTEEDLWPDPRIRTHVRVSNLQFLIGEYERRNGALPNSLNDVVPAGEGPVVLERDAWDHPIRYTLLGEENDYGLRAAGPDGVPSTSDDIVARRGTTLPLRLTTPGTQTRTVLGSIRSLVSEYRRRNGSLPADLASLEAGGLRPYLGVTDEWGNPIPLSSARRRVRASLAGPR